ncbi:hypothetical protein MKY19_18045 [Paenibacillus sp. FSL R5-0744]|uniref:hypothetical protein n=1 Tax=Paenibacillus sp. FSL R5-0744 TaxID=2921656 RepID=UPI0030DDDBAA
MNKKRKRQHPVRKQQNEFITPAILRRTIRNVLPFYREIVRNPAYSAAWVQAVNTIDFVQMERLFQKVSHAPIAELGSGYSFGFRTPMRDRLYVNGFFLDPAQSKYKVGEHLVVVQAILPLYLRLATDIPFATRVTAAINSGNTTRLNSLIRGLIRSRFLLTIRAQDSGFRISFRFPISRKIYTNYTLLGVG